MIRAPAFVAPLVFFAALACAPSGARGRAPIAIDAASVPIVAAAVPFAAAAPVVTAPSPVEPRPAPPPCDAGEIAVFEAGRSGERICTTDVAARGLTIVDLGDDWAPFIFSQGEGESEPQPYRDTFVALANERVGSGAAWRRAREDRYFELYGIPPSFSVLRVRLIDDERHACHDRVDRAALEALDRALERGDDARDVVLAVQAHLACDGMIRADEIDGAFGPVTEEALRAYQRRHMIVGEGTVDAETRATLLTDSRELEFRALLRALRARVVDATGLIEDGTAGGARGEVLGRRIDGEAFYVVETYGALPDGAPDRISPATEAAARALGWIDPAAAIASFRDGPFAATGTATAKVTGAAPRVRVALALPALPDYHAAEMDLRVEIDRGDVWYDYPYTSSGKPKPQPVDRFPRLILYARDGERDIPLIQWPTTIGGWKRERVEQGVSLRYKGSDVGDRIWRDVIVSPAWLPPKQTPRATLVRRSGDTWVANTDLLGPGYASAYGLVMFIHHRESTRRGVTRLVDNGIRTHGSVSYRSILEGESHGCHRLFNHSAVRLASFVLRHRSHARIGPITTSYAFSFEWKGARIEISAPLRGYRFELTPPVPVTVLEGNIKGRARRPDRRVMPAP